MKPQRPAGSSNSNSKPSMETVPVARKSRSAPSPGRTPPDEDQREGMVREAAYCCDEARGCLDGHELEDWLKAEADITRIFGSKHSAGRARD